MKFPLWHGDSDPLSRAFGCRAQELNHLSGITHIRRKYPDARYGIVHIHSKSKVTYKMAPESNLLELSITHGSPWP